MSRNTLPDNAYSFRTVENDEYIDRVIAEADPKTNFMIVVDEDKLTGNLILFTLIRPSVTILSVLMPELYLGELPLSAYFERAVEVKDTEEEKEFVVLRTEGDAEEIQSLAETVEHDIRHIKNIITGRTVQVTVSSF